MPVSHSRLQVTPESVHTRAWAERLTRTTAQPVASLGLHRGDRLLAVVAHPDDETLAMGATLALLAAAGVEVHVLSLTAGEAALAHVGRTVPGLAARRRRELRRAGETLGVADACALSLPDGRLAEHTDAVWAAMTRAVSDRAPDLIMTLWRFDPHPDHQAVASAALAAAARTRTPVLELALWAQHWTDPADVPQVVAPVDLGDAELTAKRRALAEYASQTEPLLPDVEPVLPAEVQAWPFECVVRS